MKTPLPVRFRITISAKLIGLVGGLLILSVAALVWIATRLFIEDNTALIQQMNADTAASLVTHTRTLLGNLAEKARIAGTGLVDGQKESSRVLQEIFDKDEALLGLAVREQAAEGYHPVATSGRYAEKAGGTVEDLLKRLEADSSYDLRSVYDGGAPIVTGLSTPTGRTVLAMTVPFIESAAAPGRFTHVMTVVVDPTPLAEAFGASPLFTSYLVDGSGRLLVHPDPARMASGENVGHLKVVEQMLSGRFNNGQTRYQDPATGGQILGAFRLVGFAGLGVVTEVPENKAKQAAERVRYRSILVAVIILCLAFMSGYFFSESLTRPIRALVDASRRIAQGDFKIALKPRSNDELGHLALAFNDMAKGLEERDRVKETFNKFHNKEIADKLLSGEVKLGGDKLNAVIFFSDVRGFTSLSERMEPEAVVEMINEYMTRMVAVIRKHGGIVDKYVGDAIMALWGVPIGKPDDTYEAVMACIEMRKELESLNTLRLERGEPPLKIGMGLNRGEVVAGNIGSNEKMEYTVIGDSVNLASRIESMTKEYGTDLLISETVLKEVGERFVVEECAAAKVKGKSKPIQLFKVTGYVDPTGKQVLVQTEYSSYKAEKSDKSAA